MGLRSDFYKSNLTIDQELGLYNSIWLFYSEVLKSSSWIEAEKVCCFQEKGWVGRWVGYSLCVANINPYCHGLKHSFSKMFSFLAAQWNVQSDWKFVWMVIIIYRLDCDFSKIKNKYGLMDMEVFLESAWNRKISKNQFFSHSSLDRDFRKKIILQIS